MSKLNKILCCFICCIFFNATKAQYNIVHINKDSLPHILNGYWKYNQTDNPSFALADYNDSNWQHIKSFLPIDKIGDSLFNGFAWFRIRISIPDSLRNKSLALDILQNGASEIYIDGRCVATYGKVSVNGKGEKRFDPYGVVIPVLFNHDSCHIIAVRYSNHKYKQDTKWDEWNAGFILFIDVYKGQTFKTISDLATINLVLLLVSGFLAALTLVHFFFFLFYRKQKHHLYYSIFTFFFSLFFFLPYFSFNTFNPDITAPLGYFIPSVIPIYLISLAGFIYYLILDKLPRFFWVNILLGIIIISGFFFKTGHNDIFYAILIGVVITQSFTALGKGKKIKKEGIGIILWGIIVFFSLVGFIGIVYLLELIGVRIGNLYISSGTSAFIVVPLIFILLSIPISISLYMAKSFATLNISLEKKLAEVKELSSRNIEQEKEKQQILANQNIILEQQVKERTIQLSEANEELHQQNEEISTQRDEIEAQRNTVSEQKNKIEKIHHEVSQSINYATRIQIAILPETTLLYQHLSEHFIIFKPKDKVSGDFYWWAKVENNLIITIADCTGHGVPGAFMSMLGTSFLREIVVKEYITSPEIILNRLRREIINALKQKGDYGEQKDGMDMALISINTETLKMNYAGANNPLYLIRNCMQKSETKLEILKPDQMPVAIYENMQSFTKQTILLQKGDSIYMMSDGYQDQFGGPNHKKFLSKNLRELITTVCYKPMAEQKELFENTIYDWKGNFEQMDDITMMGIRL